MSKTIITKKEIQVPAGVLIKVAELLLENDISNEIIATDEDEDTLTLEVSYSKEERDIIHEAEDLISEFEEEENEEDDPEDNED